MISVLQNNTTDCGAYAYDYNFKCIYLTLLHADSFVPRFFENATYWAKSLTDLFFLISEKTFNESFVINPINPLNSKSP